MQNDNIKSMKLYNFIDRVYNELRELGKATSGPLSVSELSSFDQLHYHGTQAIDFAIKKLNINHKSKILEIGSGLGGPARYLAKKLVLISLQLNFKKIIMMQLFILQKDAI